MSLLDRIKLLAATHQMTMAETDISGIFRYNRKNPPMRRVSVSYLKDPKSVMRCPFSDCPTATYLRFPEPPMYVIQI